MTRDTVKLNKTCRFNFFMPEQHGVISEGKKKKKQAFLNIGFTVKGFIV